MREGHRKLSRLSLIFASVLGAVGVNIAQDGTGRSDSVVRTSAPTARASKRRVIHRDSPRPAPAPTKRVELGKLALTVNEGGSRVGIVRLDAPGTADVIPVPPLASSLIVRTLAAGNYRISVTKPGYTEEAREVQIEDGKHHRVAVYLKPKMAFLTIGASVQDARIEIEKVGAYDTPVNRLVLKPGRYRVSVSRRGYVPQIVSVDLKAAGREETLQVVLKPFRVDQLLEDASERLAKGNYAAARELAGDVLLLNASHARANLVYGMVEQRRGGPGATPYFLRAIRNGEPYRVLVKVQDPRDSRLLDAELSVERDRLSIKSPGRVDLDLTIARGNVTALNLFPNPAPGFIVVAGKTDFHGRTVQPNLRIHPHDIVADTAARTTRCATANCTREFAELARLLRAWKSDTAPPK